MVYNATNNLQLVTTNVFHLYYLAQNYIIVLYSGLDNHWITKGWNLQRGLDIQVTNNLNHIVRIPDTGPRVSTNF